RTPRGTGATPSPRHCAVRRLTPHFRRAVRALIGPDELRLLDDMPGHRLLDVGLCSRSEIAKRAVQRVELEEIPMAPDRRARTTITAMPEIVLPFASPLRQVRRLHAFRQPA